MLPLVQRIINEEKHSAIGVAPSQLLFGNSLSLSRGVWKPRVPGKEQKLSQYMQELIAVQDFLTNTAFENQANEDYANMRGLNRDPLVPFVPGSFVVAKYENKDNRPPHKLATLV